MWYTKTELCLKFTNAVYIAFYSDRWWWIFGVGNKTDRTDALTTYAQYDSCKRNLKASKDQLPGLVFQLYGLWWAIEFFCACLNCTISFLSYVASLSLKCSNNPQHPLFERGVRNNCKQSFRQTSTGSTYRPDRAQTQKRSKSVFQFFMCFHNNGNIYIQWELFNFVNHFLLRKRHWMLNKTQALQSLTLTPYL